MLWNLFAVAVAVAAATAAGPTAAGPMRLGTVAGDRWRTTVAIKYVYNTRGGFCTENPKPIMM